MHNLNYKKIYARAACAGGWSKSRPDNTTKWGDFYALVKKRLEGDEVVLDIGTAEGHRFMGLSKYIKKGVGIDLEPGMIKLANRNKQEAGVENIVFKCMGAEHLDFPAETFDAITVKHSPINFKDAFRVLKPGGRLFTQQVSENDKLNLKKAFGRGQDYGKKSGALLGQYKKQAEQAGFKNIETKVSNIPYYFKSEKKLIDFLNKAPTIPEFGKCSKDYEILEKFIAKNRAPEGIKSNTVRFFLEMSKELKIQ
ncbi:MAG: class I SAM-dependent methyltransferase [bacterium]|nr:class I SAM-dependent methyltransferase [bacterium]